MFVQRGEAAANHTDLIKRGKNFSDVGLCVKGISRDVSVITIGKAMLRFKDGKNIIASSWMNLWYKQ